MLTLTVVLVSLILVGYLVNRHGIKTREGKHWTIEKGKHYAKWSWFPLVLKKRKVGETTTVYFQVNKSMLYDLKGEEDDLDVNKIVGECPLNSDTLQHAWDRKVAPHHINSWRVGWQFDPVGKKVHISLYTYADHIREVTPLFNFHWYGLQTAEFRLQVKYEERHTEFTLQTKGGVQLNKPVSYPRSLTGYFNYRLRPYFGGNQPAPANCHVKYKMS